MSLADVIRAHCRKTYIDTDRQRGKRYAEIRAGDVHADLNLSQRLPAVCAALGAEKFEEECGIERISIVGPLNGANTTFWFRLELGEDANEVAQAGHQFLRLIKICPKCGATTG